MHLRVAFACLGTLSLHVSSLFLFSFFFLFGGAHVTNMLLIYLLFVCLLVCLFVWGSFRTCARAAGACARAAGACVCVLCMCFMYICCMYAYMPHMHPYVCLACIRNMHALYACLICMPCMYALYVRLKCMFHMYAAYACKNVRESRAWGQTRPK